MSQTLTVDDFSPSYAHRHILRQSAPLLRYDGRNAAAWRQQARNQLYQLMRMPPRGGWATRVTRLWTHEHEWGTIDKIIISSEIGSHMPAYMCRPRYASAPYRTYICLQGHSSGMHLSIGVDSSDEITPIDVDGDRDFAISCMRRGMAALCLEQRGFGQRVERILPDTPRGLDRSCHEPAMHALMLGRTLNGERVYDVDCAIDYLESRDDIDMSRLGCMGNSTGGTVTMYALALLDRIREGICSCSFASWGGSILGVYHCVCNYVPELALWLDMGDILSIAAPKPLVLVSGVHDPLFDVESARSEYRIVQQAYRDVGAASSCRFVEGPGEHRFYADLAWDAMLKMSPLNAVAG